MKIKVFGYPFIILMNSKMEVGVLSSDSDKILGSSLGFIYPLPETN